MSVKAQRLSHDFQNTSLSEALIWIDNAQDSYKLNFIFDELEDFTVTTQLKNVSVRDAVRQVCGFYPMHLTFDEQDIYIECMQKSDTKLSGRIINESGQPVAYASISLLSLGDSTFLTGGVSNEAGDFVIPCKESKVIARITCIGYKTVEETYSVGIIGSVRIFPDKYTLKGIEVKGMKQLYKSTERGLLTNIQGTPLAQFGSVSEMLSHLPLMMSNGEIAGHGKPEIYINDKKVRDEAELDRLHADDILSAEIITNPGVEYGAEVTSVIKLKTVRRQGEGWSGNFSTAYRQGKEHYANLNAALNYRTRNGMDFFVRGYLTDNNTRHTGIGERELQTSNLWNNQYNTISYNKKRYYFADLGWSWELSEHHSIGFTYTANNLIGDAKTFNEDDEQMRQNGVLVEQNHTSTTTLNKPRMTHSVNAYYVGEIGKWKLDFSADYYGAQSLTDMEGITNHELCASSNTNTKEQLLAEKLTITIPIKKGSLNLGEEVSDVDRRSDFLQNGFSADNHIHQQTTIWSLYASYSLQKNKISFNASLRWQNELNRYNLNGKRDEEMSPDFHVLVPRISTSFRTKRWNHTIAYQCYRVSPPYDLLSSSIRYIGKYEYRTGNPFLEAQTKHSFSWESKYRWLYIEAVYNHARKGYTSFYSAYDDKNHPGVILMDFRMIPTTDFYMLNINASPKIGIWQMNYTISAEFRDMDVKALGITHKYNGLCTSLTLDNTFTLPRSWLLNIQGSIEPYQESGYMQLKTHGSLDLRLSKQFLKDKSLSVAFLAKDILHTAGVKGTEYNGINFRSNLNVYRDQQRIGIDLSWKFNATKSRYKGSHAGQSERNRL